MITAQSPYKRIVKIVLDDGTTLDVACYPAEVQQHVVAEVDVRYNLFAVTILLRPNVYKELIREDLDE